MKFILWDPKDGDPRRDDDGGFVSDGLIGRVDLGNAYLQAYAKYETGSREALTTLEPGQFFWAEFSLSGSRGRYQIFRVS